MKLLINKKMYVQVKDILFIIKLLPKIDIEYPKSFLIKVLDKTYIKDEKNKYEFIEFETQEEIDFFKKLDFIIDYKDYKKISYDKMNKYIQDIGNELNILSDKYHDLNEEEQNKKYDKYNTLFEKKYYKMESIRELYKIKTGKLQIDIPSKAKKLKKIFKK